MIVDDEELREILRLFKLYQIRMIIEERGTNITSNDQEELIDALVDEEWSEEEFENLIDRLQIFGQEGRPLGYYICVIEEHPDIETFTRTLRQHEAEFDEEGHLIEGGYQINDISDTEFEATRWKVDINKSFNFRTGEIEMSEDVKPVSFTVDTDEERVFIETNQYGKARNISTTLEKAGFEFSDIGHRNMAPENANDRVRSFVESLGEEVD